MCEALRFLDKLSLARCRSSDSGFICRCASVTCCASRDADAAVVFCQRESKRQSFTFLSLKLISTAVAFSVKVTSSLYKTIDVAASSPASLAAAGIVKSSQSLLPPGRVGFHRDVTSLRSSQLHLVPVTSSSTEGGCLEMLPAGGWHDGRVTFQLWSMLLPLTLLPISCLFSMGIINNAALLAHRFWHKGSEVQTNAQKRLIQAWQW